MLAINDLTFDDLKKCMMEIYYEEENFEKRRRHHVIENYKINWLISRIEYKLHMYAEQAQKLAHQIEYMQKSLWGRIKTAISFNRIENPKPFIEEFYNIVVPAKTQFKIAEKKQ